MNALSIIIIYGYRQLHLFGTKRTYSLFRRSTTPIISILINMNLLSISIIALYRISNLKFCITFPIHMPINCIPIIILGIFITYLKQVAAIITYLCYRQIYKLPYSLRNLAILCFSNIIAKVDLFHSHRYRYTSVHPVHICLQRFIHYRTICDCLI